MSFTPVEITGRFETQAGQPAAGTLTFTLTQAMSNMDVTIAPQPIIVTLDAEGKFAVVLLANDDPETTPQGIAYGVTEQVTGAQPRDYVIVVPHATSPVDLSTLMPGEPGLE